MRTKMKKYGKLLAALMLVSILLLSLGACAEEGVPTTAPVPHSITVQENIEGGTVTVDKTSALKGETVTVTATPDENYILAGITANGLPVENGSFTMGDEDVVVGATFTLNTDRIETNAGTEGGALITAPSMGGGDAKAQIFTVFGENGIEFTAYVTDAGISDKDGVALLLSKKLPVINQLLPDGQTVKVAILTDGTVTIAKTDAEGKLEESTLPGTDISVKLWSKDGKALQGYIVRANVSYEALGLEKDNAKGNVTVCPVVYNAYGSVAAKATALGGALENAQNTYMVLTDDNTYAENPFKATSAQLGSAGGILAGTGWDLSKDYYKEDTENWPNRVAVLTGHDGIDNNLVFYGVSAQEMYAEATIRITGVANPNDQWPKFGMMLFNGSSQNGVFYYVDAVMKNPTGNTTADITGTALGYNKGTNGWSANWQMVKDNVFNTNTLTIRLQMVYQNGWLHMYANDAYIESVWAGEYNDAMHFGLKSFGLEMEVTNYLASSDPIGDGWADKLREEGEKAQVDILFAGDSYMDFWKNRYQAAHMSDYTTYYANEGIGGTVVPQWIQKANEMARLYDPYNIVFHIGVNDIDGGASVDNTVANLKTLFETYHELFPNAKLYWNSLIPNTMFPDKVADYYAVNAQMVSYAADKAWLIYIDQTPSFEKAPGVANPMFFDDGLHLSADIGYPLWVKNMMTAMGYARENGSNMGDNGSFAHSGGWTYQNGTAYLNHFNEMTTYFNGAQGELVYVEAMVSIGQLYNNDAYPKFGFTAHGADQSMWAFIDAAGYPGNKPTVGFFVSRGVANNNGIDYYTAWNWNTVTGGGSFTGNYSDGEFVKLAIAKYNGTLYLLGNDKVLATVKMDGSVTIGFQVFSMETTLKDVVVLKDESVIKEKLGLFEPTSAVIDGKADDAIWTEEVLGNAVQMGHKGDGRYFETAAVKAPDGVYFLVTTYSHENTRPLSANWWENANIEFRFGTDPSQYFVYYAGPGFGEMTASAGIAAVASSGGQQLENGLWKATAEFFVPYKTLAGYDANSAEIPVYLWGWVFDEGWKDGMNVGGYPALSVSEHGLRFQHGISVLGNNSAVTVTPSAENAYVGDKILLDVQTNATLESITAATAGGVAVEVKLEEGVYSFIMPNDSVTVTVRLQGISVSSQIIGLNKGTISCDSGVVVPTEEVPFSVSAEAGYKVVAVKVNGQALELSADGNYKYVVKDTDTGVAIEAQVDYDTEGWTIDGVQDAAETWGQELNFLVEDNRSVSVWAVKGQYGVYFYVRAYTNSSINDNTTEWWMNHNFEFYLNHGEQCYVNSRNEARGAAKHVWISEQIAEGAYAGKWMHTAELFVPKDLIAGFEDGVTLNYAFKAPYEAARWEYMPNNQWDMSDWWRTSLGAPNECETDFGKVAVPNWLKITDTGLVNTRPAAQNGTIDGKLDEYAGKLDLYRGNENAYFHIMGYEANDGVYLAFEIWQKSLAAPTPEWHLNDNIEIRINNVQCGFSLYENFMAPWGNVNSWTMQRVASDRDGYDYKTVVEMFVKMDNITKHSYVWIGCNGNGFGGWQSLCWDGNLAWTSADGIGDAWGAAAGDGVTVDGLGNEAFYAGKESVTFTPNGATVTMTGAKLEHGASFLLTINHSRPVTDNLQGAEDWWSYLNFELYLGEGTPQAKASVWNRYSYWCASNYTTVDNGNGTYTTVMEIYIPYGLACGKDVNNDFLLGLGAVVDGGYNWCAEWATGVWLTDKGVIKK